MRCSDYTIQIPLHTSSSQEVLMHGYTGAIDIVPESTYQRLRDGILDLPSEQVIKLQERGYITNKTAEEENAYVRRIAKVMMMRNARLKKDFTFIVSYNCNFRCPYCFENNRLNQPSHVALTTDIVDFMFEAMLKIEPNRQLHNDVITLFGGEPLLKANVALVEYIVAKGKELGYRFTATTNGYDLDNYLHLLSQNMIYGVQITIDGTKETHNQRRKHHSENDTFSKIIANIKSVLQVGALIKVRVNIDASNIDELQDLLFYLRTEQILDHPNFKIYVEYISGAGNFCPENYKNRNTEQEIKPFIYTLAKLSPNVPYSLSLYSNLFNAILRGKALAFNPQHCGANSQSYILDPDGNIYACHEFVGSREQIIGSYMPDIKWNCSVLDAWHKRQALQIDNCSHCKYALLCGGGCGARSIITKNQFCCNDFQARLTGITNILINKIPL